MGQQACSRCGGVPVADADVTTDMRAQMLQLNTNYLPKLDEEIEKIQDNIKHGDFQTPNHLDWDIIEERIKALKHRIKKWESGEVARAQELFSEALTYKDGFPKSFLILNVGVTMYVIVQSGRVSSLKELVGTA